MKKTVLIVLGLAGIALAATPALTLVLNGKISSEKAITVNGKTYVPLSSLTALGIKVSSGSGLLSLTSGSSGTTKPVVGNSPSSSSGGANQKASVSGCQNEWLFNGIWRLRVTKMEAIIEPDGSKPIYQVTVQLSNGTTQTLKPSETGIKYDGAYNIVFDDGNSFAAPTNGVFQDKTYAKMPQGTSTLMVLNFPTDDDRTLEQARAKLPQKFLFEVKPEELDKDLKVGFTVKDPSFRVDLTCKK